jgi:hypothetical protein
MGGSTSDTTSGQRFEYRVAIVGDGGHPLDPGMVETALTLGLDRLFHTGSLGHFGRAHTVEAEPAMAGPR